MKNDESGRNWKLMNRMMMMMMMMTMMMMMMMMMIMGCPKPEMHDL